MIVTGLAPKSSAPALANDLPVRAPVVAADRIVARPTSLAVAANPMPMLAAPRAMPPPDVRFPRNLCIDGRCTPETSRLWSAFQDAGQVDLAKLPRVFSGDVHWMMPGYDQNHAHHGGVFIDAKADGSLSFNGRFSFFAESDPYAKTTVDEARTWAATVPAQRNSDYLYANANPKGGMPMEYWLRQDAKSGNLYLVAFWGDGRFGLGELHPH